MNFSFFISNRLRKNNSSNSFSYVSNRMVIVTIAIGLGVLLLSFMILNGFKDEIKNKIYGFSGHLLISKYTFSTSYDSTPIIISDTLLESLQHKNIAHIQPYALKAGLIKVDEEIQGIVFKGMDKNYQYPELQKYLVAGRIPHFPETDKKYSTEIIISKKLSSLLGLAIGEQILICFLQSPPRYRKLKVVGIYQTGLEEFDTKMILGDIALIRRINNWEKNTANGIELSLHAVESLDQTAEMLFNEISIDLYMEKSKDIYVEIFDWLTLLDKNVVILLVIVLFVAISGIISIMLIMILERTQMVGLLLALGASRALIQQIFVWNGVFLILKGIFFGNILGIGLGIIQRYGEIIKLNPVNYYMELVPISFDFTTLIYLNFFVLLICILSLLIPITVIQRMNIIKTIKFA